MSGALIPPALGNPHLVAVAPGGRTPCTKGWTDQRLSPEEVQRHLDRGGNIALLSGRRSNWVVDIDLDCDESLILAPSYLSQTAKFGRRSRPLSHWLYTAMGATFVAFADPVDGEMLVELRSDGETTDGAHITLIPPSVADGERREWDGDIIAPAVVDARALRLAVARLAVGCLVARYVSLHAAQRPGPDLPRLLHEFDHVLGRAAFKWLGMPDPDAPKHYPRRREEMSPEDIDLAEVVHAIPNSCSWEEWNNIGLAIFAASGGSGDGKVIFDDFSAKSPRYEPWAIEERWRNYGRSPPARTGHGKLIKLALAAGWRPRDDKKVS